MGHELTTRHRERLDRWSREADTSGKLEQRRAAMSRRRADLAAAWSGEIGEVAIERLASGSAWVEPAEVRLALEQLDPEAIARRLSDALATRERHDDRLRMLASDPFPSFDFLAELYGWGHADTCPIHAPWTGPGLTFFGFPELDGYQGELAAFAVLASQLRADERAGADLPLAYELDALFEELSVEDLAGFAREDVSVFGFAGGSPDEVASPAREDLDYLWDKANRLLIELGRELFKGRGFDARLWPWVAEDQTFPFLWGRLKLAGAEAYATHVGIFISVDHCNLCIDLEKDLIDVGAAAEELPQVHRFWDLLLGTVLPDSTPDNLQVWTDPENVLSVRQYLDVGFRALMAANRDLEHPWPRLGHLLEVREVTAMGGAWVEEMARLGRPLVEVYEHMLVAYQG